MSQDKSLTFGFVGDEAVAKALSASIEAAGFASTDVTEADVVFTYCASLSKLEDLYYDTEGLIRGTKEQAILVDLSPATVSFAKELNALASVNDRFVLDAPLVVRDVVVPDAFSRSSNVSICVGGSEKVFKKVEAMLRACADKVFWVGKAGSGQSMKIALTLQSAAALVGLVEAQASFATSELDIDLEDHADIALSLGMLTPAQEHFLQAMNEDELQGSYTIECLMGDLIAALSSIDDGESVLPQAESGFRLVELLALVGGVSYNPAALKLVFSDEESGKRFGLDWSRAEGAYDHECSCDHDDPDHECGCGGHDDLDHECACGHDHGEEHECCGKHHH